MALKKSIDIQCAPHLRSQKVAWLFQNCCTGYYIKEHFVISVSAPDSSNRLPKDGEERRDTKGSMEVQYWAKVETGFEMLSYSTNLRMWPIL